MLYEPPLDWTRHLDNRFQNRHREFREHGLKLARRTRQNKHVRRRNARIDVRLQIKTRGASVLVRKDARACEDIRLPCNTRSPFDSAHLQSLSEAKPAVAGPDAAPSPSDSATISRVISSVVGPRPPVTNRISQCGNNSVSVRRITSLSGTVRRSSIRRPNGRISRAINARCAS